MSTKAKGTGGLAGKRKQPSAASASASRAQRNKLASKAAKRSKAASASSATVRGQRAGGDEEEELGGNGLLFETDDEEDGEEDIRIRAPRRMGGGGSDDEDADGAEDDGPPPDPYANETPDEKRVRLTREYLKKVEQDVEEEDDVIGSEVDEEEAAEERQGITRDAAIDRRLKKDLAAQRGTLKLTVCHTRYDLSSFPAAQAEGWTRHRPAHKKGGATCITMTEDNAAIYTGGKDCNIVAWDVETGKQVYTMYGNIGGKNPANPGHTGDIMSLSVSGDGQFLASGAKDGCVKIWDPRAKYACVRSFHGAHKGAIPGLVFRGGSHQLFSGSVDRTIKIWNIDQLAYVETLYGHTSDVTCLDSLYKDRCLSVSRDKTARLWKVVEESQVMFRSSVYAESLDAVSMVNEDQFLTGAQDGTVSAWMVTKKKPTSVIQNAHGGKWINCVGAQKFTDVCFSGSSDGFLNLYCLESSGQMTNKLSTLHRIPVIGHINGLVSDAKDGRFVALAVGSESRFGRWDKIQPARGGLHLISLAGIERSAQEMQERAEAERVQREEHESQQQQQQDGVGDDEHMDDGEEDELDEDDDRPRKRAQSTSTAATASIPTPAPAPSTAFADYPASYAGSSNGRGRGRGGARGGSSSRGGPSSGRGGSRGGSSRGGSSRGGGGGGRGGGRGRGR